MSLRAQETVGGREMGGSLSLRWTGVIRAARREEIGRRSCAAAGKEAGADCKSRWRSLQRKNELHLDVGVRWGRENGGCLRRGAEGFERPHANYTTTASCPCSHLVRPLCASQSRRSSRGLLALLNIVSTVDSWAMY